MIRDDRVTGGTWRNVGREHDGVGAHSDILGTHIRSGRKWCSKAQKARPFRHDVVKLVIFTPR